MTGYPSSFLRIEKVVYIVVFLMPGSRRSLGDFFFFFLSLYLSFCTVSSTVQLRILVV